ncbi:MAG: class I SAM-dependent methyltransferase [Halobacteriota archaeon]|nr:class I SAM-dependent methyltransferase [Halobacteriota archaeon]
MKNSQNGVEISPWDSKIEYKLREQSEWDAIASAVREKDNVRLDSLLIKRAIDYSNLKFDGKRVLDVGCGRGREAEEISKAGGYVVGLDISTGQLEAFRRYSLSIFEKDCHFVLGDGERLPFPDDSFDLSFIFSSLHHLTDPYRCISEMIRVTKESIIIVDSMNPFITRVLTKIGLFIEEDIGTNPNRLDEEHLKDILEDLELDYKILPWFYYAPHTVHFIVNKYEGFYKIVSRILSSFNIIVSRFDLLGGIFGNYGIIVIYKHQYEQKKTIPGGWS